MKQKMSHIKTSMHDLWHTLFPDLCLACLKMPKTRDAYFCIECLHDMPYTDHFIIKDNNVTRHFKGRISLHHGAALLRYREESIVQNMLHGLKYKKRKEVGEVMGAIAGSKFLDSSIFLRPDIIVPVPVHHKKVLRRGYNQSTIFGYAVSEQIGVPFVEDVLTKVVETKSQTGKSRTARVANVEEVFVLNKPADISGKHVLLVDDVVTTGATIEACCLKMQETNVSKISVLTIAAAL
ncbi:MAG: ComF family protein [Saprospiraceae bacterium]|nr:ComF family protein [Saprospiraceae bacterium]